MRRAPAALIAALTLALLTTTAHAEKHPRPEAQQPAHVGIAVRVFTPAAPRDWRGSPDHHLHVTVWYPVETSAIETPQLIGPPGSPLLEAGSAAPNAQLIPSLHKLPLIVLSHGTGGSAMQLAWLGTQLARAGFIAAAVDHPGNNGTEPYTAQGFVLWWERATDLSNVIDAMLADSEFGPRIDADRIGAAGFSIGGYTVMELAGAQTDISILFDHCKAEPNYIPCHTAEMKEMGTPEQMLQLTRRTSGVSIARSGESYRDNRVDAVFAIAPYAEVLTEDSLKSIRIPVEVVVGASDPIVPAAINADRIRAFDKTARESILPGGVAHYTFLDTCTAAGKADMGVLCEDKPDVDRDTVHSKVADMAIDFFRHSLQLR